MTSPSPSFSTIVLEQAGAEQDAALARIAALDSARPLARPVVTAVADGRLVAAASLLDGRLVADPFVDTRDAVALLRARIGARRRARPRFRLRHAV
jgi:hypothetical protein